MDAAHAAIEELVHRETRAWDTQDAELLLSVLHTDMVWPWPPHELVHNQRVTRRIAVTPEGDGGFAVVDVDTLWRRRRDPVPQHWLGRACKLYTRLADGD
jgi:hypothetical protein